MFDFTFLTHEQVFGENQLEIFKKIKYTPIVPDFAFLHGIMTFGSARKKENSNCCSGLWWLKSKYGSTGSSIYTVSCDLRHDSRNPEIPYIGVRPAIEYSSISPFVSNVKKIKDGILEVDFGFYPRDTVSDEFANELECAYNMGNLMKTSRVYTYKSCGYTNSKEEVPLRQLEEYVYDGERYIRFLCHECRFNASFHSNQHVITGDVYWIKVEPIKWFVDEKNNIALSKDILFSGIKFTEGNFTEAFEDTTIKKFMDKYFAKEIIPVKIENYDENYAQNDVFSSIAFYSLDDWIDWSNANNIHPLIHMFIISTGCKYINSEYDWTEMSNILYESKDIDLLCDLLDKEVYNEFVNLYSIGVSIDDILNNNYDMLKLSNMSNIDKYLLMVKLSLIDEKDYEIIYNFVSNFEKKYIRMFDKIYHQCKKYIDNQKKLTL